LGFRIVCQLFWLFFWDFNTVSILWFHIFAGRASLIGVCSALRPLFTSLRHFPSVPENALLIFLALAMLAGIITPPIIISGSANFDAKTEQYLVSTSLSKSSQVALQAWENKNSNAGILQLFAVFYQLSKLLASIYIRLHIILEPALCKNSSMLKLVRYILTCEQFRGWHVFRYHSCCYEGIGTVSLQLLCFDPSY